MDKWEKLKTEIEFLNKQGVTNIHPLLISGYMSYIEQLDQAEEKAAENQALIQELRKAAEERI